MATGINLLPQGKVLKGRDKALVDAISKLVFVGLIIFIASILVIGAYLVYTSLRIRASVSNEEVLKAEVGALADTEQSFFLIKDRVSKIKIILAKDSLNEQIVKLSGFLKILSPDVRLIEVQAANQKVTLGLGFVSSQSFGAFYKGLVESGTYKTIILKSLSFNPLGGYIATLELSDE